MLSFIIKINYFIENYYFDDDNYSQMKKYASKMIQKYTYRKKEDCFDYINKKLLFETEPSKFVLGYPIEVFDVIDE